MTGTDSSPGPRNFIREIIEADRAAGRHPGGVVPELVSSDRRAVRTGQFIRVWREAVEPLPGLESLTLRGSRAGPPGNDVDVRLEGHDVDALERATLAIRASGIPCQQLGQLRVHRLLDHPPGAAAQQLRQGILDDLWRLKSNYAIFAHAWRTSFAVNQSLAK